ncbi:putative vacuolar protein sorting-associated protein 13D-like [Apostichopus japonicus]|uniref:Putative vacuolar protein sorting-associated protein 13D-like n=1 Tax=Stichopus japonicus TaxID=307972 RepID=A0A2G8LF25_STIJA|nr:putative vacuolar protein sorting-associated protein 13D-like [Apostichopus japonicus]
MFVANVYQFLWLLMNKVKRWDVQLEIAAPQIIVPDSFHRKDATLVVLDFGRLQLTSNTAKGKGKSETSADIDIDDNEDLDDDFCTPLSTPPSEYSMEEEAMVTMEELTEADLGSELTQEALRAKLYDSYTLNLSDLQVMVGRATNNWKMANARSQSPLQVVKKFNISVKVERRLMFTTDPQWPSATLSGSIPSLSIHVNEQKILALNHCLTLLTDSDKDSRAGDVSVHGVFAKPETKTADTSGMEETFTQKTQALLEESRLLETQFCVDKISLEVQSRSRTIVELQVFGAKANLTKRPYDTSISLTVHGLLLIDALQQFGPDFELLVASHKDLSIHAPSGSIVDSETSTPRSPASPQSPASPVERGPEVPLQPDFASRLTQAGKNLSAALCQCLLHRDGRARMSQRKNPWTITATRKP